MGIQYLENLDSCWRNCPWGAKIVSPLLNYGNSTPPFTWKIINKKQNSIQKYYYDFGRKLGTYSKAKSPGKIYTTNRFPNFVYN